LQPQKQREAAPLDQSDADSAGLGASRNTATGKPQDKRPAETRKDCASRAVRQFPASRRVRPACCTPATREPAASLSTRKLARGREGPSKKRRSVLQSAVRRSWGMRA